MGDNVLGQISGGETCHGRKSRWGKMYWAKLPGRNVIGRKCIGRNYLEPLIQASYNLPSLEVFEGGQYNQFIGSCAFEEIINSSIA